MINRINLNDRSMDLSLAEESSQQNGIPMTAIQKLTIRLQTFPENEQEELATILLSELDALAWDKQIEADVKAGKLDGLIDQAKKSHKDGRTTPLQP